MMEMLQKVNELKIADSVLDLVGNTPMIRISKLAGKNDATVLAKLEWYNISGSVKDRMAMYLIKKAEEEGRLSNGKTILEATSGNTGISLAMIAAAKGYRMTIVMPESVSIERRKIIKAYGAELILSPAEKGTAGAIEVKQQMFRQYPEKYVDVDQFKDPANILAHYETTGKEILEQTDGRVDMVILGVGTAGTGVGVSHRVKKIKPNIKVVGVMPKLGTSIQGLRNPGEPFPTQLFDRNAFDEIIEIGKEETQQFFGVARNLAEKEGLFVGLSAGAIMYIALKKARELGSGKMIVAVLPDSGLKYLSTPLFD